MNIFSKQLLISKKSVYEEGQVILKEDGFGTYTSGSSTNKNQYASITGTLEILQNGVYKIELIGGGGAGSDAKSCSSSTTYYTNYYYACAGGGSGACFVGEVYCKAGTYTYQQASAMISIYGHFYIVDSRGISGSTNLINGEVAKTTLTRTTPQSDSSYIKSSNGFSIIAGGGYGGSTTAGYTAKVATATGGKGGTLSISLGSNKIKKTIIRSNGNDAGGFGGKYASSKWTEITGTTYTANGNTFYGSETTEVSYTPPDTQYKTYGYGYGAMASSASGTESGKAGFIRVTYLRRS